MLQVLINQVLELDPALDRYLALLEGKCLSIICTDFPSRSTYCTFSNSRVLFSSSAPQQVDVQITSSLHGFVKFALSKQRADLKITGDASIAQLVEKLYLNLNIDWEEELSKVTGDVIAYQALNIMRQLKQYADHTGDSLSQMIAEYLQEEADLLPTHYEVEAFNQDVDELRLRVDRLEARIKSYEGN